MNENFSEVNHNNSSPHLESNIDLQHHIKKGYTHAIDNDVNIYRQLEHKLNCFANYQAKNKRKQRNIGLFPSLGSAWASDFFKLLPSAVMASPSSSSSVSDSSLGVSGSRVSRSPSLSALDLPLRVPRSSSPAPRGDRAHLLRRSRSRSARRSRSRSARRSRSRSARRSRSRSARRSRSRSVRRGHSRPSRRSRSHSARRDRSSSPITRGSRSFSRDFRSPSRTTRLNDPMEKSLTEIQLKIMDGIRPLLYLKNELDRLGASRSLKRAASTALSLVGNAFSEVTKRRRLNVLRQTDGRFVSLLEEKDRFLVREGGDLFGRHFLRSMVRTAREEENLRSMNRSGGHIIRAPSNFNRGRTAFGGRVNGRFHSSGK
ncbi:Uncharacterized protein APZ42_026589, partial [Daphnia magna]